MIRKLNFTTALSLLLFTLFTASCANTATYTWEEIISERQIDR